MNAPAFGHNEATVRLGMLAHDAQLALERVSRGQADAIEGWLAYGAALNEGRALFAGDREFGQWLAGVSFDNLSLRPNEHEQAAACWAAANPEQFEEARVAGNARTVRGIHARWQAHKTRKQHTPGSNGGYHSECVFVPRRDVWAAIYNRFGGVA